MAETQTKTCQNCKNPFAIEPEDFQFYERIKVPPPTWCYLCRFERRGTYRNQMNLYSVKCGLCGKQVIAMYAPESPFPVYCQACWWSDGWDPTQYGRDYDFSKPFFVQYRELLERTPRLALSNKNAVNSEYCNYAANNRNCYLCFSIGDSEDCLYCGPQFVRNKGCVNSAMTIESEQCHSVVDCEKCYGLYYCQNSDNCLNSAFLFDCRNCQDCLGCVNLRNKRYHILNQPYGKEEYERKLKEYDLGSYKGARAFEEQFRAFLRSQVHKFMRSFNSTNVTGESITHSKNCRVCFAADKSENCKYSYIINKTSESYDVNGVYPATELSYDSFSVVESNRVKFNLAAMSGSLDLEYTDTCASTEHAFGCISLKKRQYCILNTQYSKEEFEALRGKVITHMNEMPYTDGQGRMYAYGEFFPPEFSPFGYNDTLAQEFFPLTRAEVEKKGWRWQEPVERDVQITMRTEDIPDDVAETDDAILHATLECAHKKQCHESCTGAFKILEPELAFHRRHGIALPRICVKCRAFERIRWRNPLQLWSRTCQCAGAQSAGSVYKNTASHFHGSGACPNAFETSYAPERPEIVYCEQCYNAEVV